MRRAFATALVALGAGVILQACGGDGSVGASSGNAAGTTAQAGAGGKAGSAGSGGATAGFGGAPTGCSATSPCTDGKTCCGNKCFDTKSDPTHCGSCDPCPGALTGDVSCVAGACKTTCAMGKADCNSIPADGCEAVLATDKNNCGKCGTSCIVANADGACAAGACTVGACKPGFGDCDKTVANGCESALDNDPANCGGCGKACPSYPNAKAVCELGQCKLQLVCNTGFADCNKKIDDGCEVNVFGDVNSCGQCGTVCPTIAHGKGGCSMGACTVASCDSGFADCNKSLFDGCESELSKDGDNCSMCGQKCVTPSNGDPACVAGKCTIAACAQGFGDCDKNPANGCETDVSKDPKNCGVCGSACPTPAHGTASCSNFQCGIAKCDMGFADCFGGVADGCETNLYTVDHCGSCGNKCAQVPHATVACFIPECRIDICDPNYRDCDQVMANGCEVSILDDPKHCSACNKPCAAIANGTPGCTAGKCDVKSCNPGFADCDGNPANGCEFNTQADGQNCGGCGVVCGTNQCSGGKCVCSKNVLVLADDSQSGSQALADALTAGGFTVTLSAVPSWKYDGTNPALTGFGAVVLLSGGPNVGAQNSTVSDMPAAGQQAIVDFVGKSNGLILTEWAAQHVAQGRWTTLAPLVLLERTESFAGQVTYTVDGAFSSHPLWAGLPASFTFSSTSNKGLTKVANGNVRVAGSPQALDAVAIRNLPSVGRVVQLAHAGNYQPNGWSNTDLQKLMVNAVGWSARCE